MSHVAHKSRRIYSNEELTRLLQTSRDLNAEGMLLPVTIADELDVREFCQFYEENTNHRGGEEHQIVIWRPQIR